MKIEFLNKLNELGFFKYVSEISNQDFNSPSIEALQQITEDKFAQIGLSAFIYKFFRERKNLLGCVYSNASGYLFECHDNKGGTSRISSGYSGDDEMSGTYTTFELAQESLFNQMINFKHK